MDAIDLRILNLERLVISLKAYIASTTQQALANSTVLNNSGPATSTDGGGACGGAAPNAAFTLDVSSESFINCNTDAGLVSALICANSYRDFQINQTSCVIRVYNTFSTLVPFGTQSLYLMPAPQLGQASYVITSVV